MLPFLKIKRQPVSGLIIKKRQPDSEAPVTADSEDNASIETQMHAMKSALDMGDMKAAANALKDAVQLIMRHTEAQEEGAENDGPGMNTLKARNILAAGEGE